jgi:y4mF family transcriptional regulator
LFRALEGQVLADREPRHEEEWTAPLSIFDLKTIGALIRAQRKQMELSQAEFSKRANLGRRFISELEAGKPTLAFNHVLWACHAAGLDLTVCGRTTA